MEKETKELHESVEKLTKQVGTMEKRINALESRKAAPELKPADDGKAVIKGPPAIPTKTFKNGKQEFRFTRGQFTLPGKGLITAEEAMKDPDILDQLVKMQAGVIREVF